MPVVRSRGGREFVIRPIRADDGDRLRAAYDSLSPRSQYRRFHVAKPHLSASETRYLVDVDGTNHYALVATPLDRPDWIAAVARFVRLPEDPHTAEIAVVVGDPFQGEGLATHVLEALGEKALARGITRFRATVLTENIPAHRMLRRMSRGHASERRLGPVVEIEVDLARAQAAPLR